MDNGNHASHTPSLRRESPAYESTILEEHVAPNDPEDDETCPLETRWWLASTAFPLLAGTFGPTASAFSICSLADRWRVKIPLGGSLEDAEPVPDPKWAVVINSISLGFALVSNFSLLLNMARRLPFPIAQPITIGGWYISSGLLICLAALLRHRTDTTTHRMTQAYYYAIIAAAIYFLVSSLMVVTVFGAQRKHYSKEFRLTTNQRSLMLQTITWLVYLLGGAAIFAHVEEWAYLDAVYWADVTLLTDGFGDIAPKTHTGRSLLFPYAVGGILTLALVVTSIRDLMIERGKNAIIARRTELTRKRIADQVRQGTGRVSGIKLPPISDPSQLSESQRQEAEFYLMRQIHKVASFKIKWFLLGVAVCAWMALWLLGALAFFLAEQAQNWSYFESLYFAYTSLLTIGYGDFTPGDTWGKPFLVFWSLLAIPTMTILFSSMGSTIAKFVEDATNFAGELTVLPGETSFKDVIASPLQQLRELSYQTPRALLNHTISRAHRNENIPAYQTSPSTSRVFTGHGELSTKDESRVKDIQEATTNPHQRRYIIIREIRKIYRDLNAQPPKRYTYDEWYFYLSLVGKMELCSSYINIPHSQIEEIQGIDHPRIGLRTSVGVEKPNVQNNNWSWIGTRSPLIGDKDEAQWIFEALSAALEHDLKQQSLKKYSEQNGA
ncbi:potassium channel protein [Blastomyces gilchristii SLH14081]|uniref:Potassium channel protein n=1 Tax=Blastomyces gilchristii (strain SLH14081) TaxID=559298 RepID=A0A179UEV6_BLAGS|nr:potassium channel protein [Blastomyces gilchristii SLH14081]OAT06555.1 potassium channel protein [Blastomyces gilchristii SLH14081]